MITVALIGIGCGMYWLWRYLTARSDEPPFVPGAWPVLGHIPLLIGDSCSIKSNLARIFPFAMGSASSLTDLAKYKYFTRLPSDLHNPVRELWSGINELSNKSYDYGGVVAARFGPRTVYIVTDPDDMLTIANTCLEKDDFYKFAICWLGKGLITANVSVWKQHRKLLSPAFSQIVLDSFMGVFNSQSRKLVKDLEKEIGKGSFNHWTYTKNSALETICLTSLGVDFTESVLNSKYVEAIDVLFSTLVERFMKFWWHSRQTFKFSNLKKQRDACLKILHNMSNTILQKRKSEFTGNVCAERNIIPGTRFKAFMDLLLELSLGKRVLTDKQIREYVDTMIVGAYDTSANVLMFTLLLLGAHPDVQEKVVAEIKEVFGEEDRDVEKHELSRLMYLEAVIKESMRIHTIAPVVARKIIKDVKLKNCTLSAGRTCFLFLFGLHRHPIWGPDRHQFKPERWLDPSQLPDNPNAFVAFSIGRRMCIGKAYAYMSLKTSLVHLLRRYRINANDSELRLKLDVMLKPDSGYYISIEKRT